MITAPDIATVSPGGPQTVPVSWSSVWVPEVPVGWARALITTGRTEDITFEGGEDDGWLMERRRDEHEMTVLLSADQPQLHDRRPLKAGGRWVMVELRSEPLPGGAFRVGKPIAEGWARQSWVERECLGPDGLFFSSLHRWVFNGDVGSEVVFVQAASPIESLVGKRAKWCVESVDSYVRGRQWSTPSSRGPDG